MNLIQRMYILDFLKTLVVLAFGIAVIFSIIGLVDKLDEFLPFNPPMKLLVSYALNTVPKYMLYLMPMAILLSSLFVFSQAIRRREIVVIKAAGGKLKSLLRPFIALGILLMFISFLLGEVIVPDTSKRLRAISNQITKKERKVTFREGTLYIRGKDGSIARIGLYLPDRDAYQAITIFRMGEKGLQTRIDADSAIWEQETWKLKNARTLSMETGKVTLVSELEYPGIESPKAFQSDVWKVEEMSVRELLRFKNRLQDAGFRNTKLSTDISSRIAYPIINLFMLLLGISLSVGGDQRTLQKVYALRIFQNTETHAGVVSAGIGLMISLAYWLGYSFFLSLGYAGSIQPVIAPWIVPIAFSGISAYLFYHIPE